MKSIGRMAACATLVVGAFWPAGALAQTTLTRTSSFAYDPGTGLLIQEVIEPNTQSLRLETDYAYDAFGNKTQVTVSGVDIATRSTSTSYAPSNGAANGQFPTGNTNALNQTETWQYDLRFGKPTSHTGPNGLTTTWQYDSFGRKTREIRADNTQTTFIYVPCAGCANIPNLAYYVMVTPVDASNNQNGAKTWVLFDTLDRELYRCADAFDGTPTCTQTVYDGVRRVQKKSRPYFYNTGTPQWTTYTYDLLSRVTVESLPDGHTIQHAFHGLVTTDANQNNQTRTVAKNSQGQVVSVTDALGNLTTYAYDPFGNMLQTVDATGHNIVTATYDLRGRKIASSDPDLGAWTYAYNTLGQLISQTDAKGQTSTLGYDVLGRLTQRVEADMTATWVYDTAQYGIGKLASATATGPAAGANGFQRSLSYDSLGRPISVATTVDQSHFHIDGAYDANGRLMWITYASGFAVRYSYTSLGYVQQLSDGRTGQVFWTANARDAEMRLTRDTAGNGITTARGFDALTGRLTSIVAGSGNAIESFSYTYDGVGNVLTRADANTNVVEGFGYDALNRLTSSSVTTGGNPVSKLFSYDSVGNLLTKSDVGNYAYPAAGQTRPHGVLNIGGGAVTATFSYDPNGNQLTATGTNLSRTVAYTSYNKPGSITQGAKTLVFADDVDHQRYKQTTPENTTWYFDAFGIHAELVNSASSWGWTDYLMVGGSMVGARFLHGDGSVSFRYFHQDSLGSIAVLTDETGAVVERDAYDPWGKRRFTNGSDDPAGSLANSSQTIRGYTGQEMLADVGLVHLNGRVYDPYVARMLSADPMVPDPLNGQTWNRYSYVGNNPLAFTDPTGYCILGLCGIDTFFNRIFTGIQHFLQRNPLIGSIFQIAVTAACVAAGEVCAPLVPLIAGLTSFAIAGVTTGSLDYALKAGLIAGLTAVAFNAVGDITLGPGHPTPEFGSSAFFENVAGHALVGCGSAVASGGKCGAGALSAAVPAFAGPVINNLPFGAALVANSTLGGLASVAGGGKFENGAVTGAFGYLFNAEGGRLLGGIIGGAAVGALTGPEDVPGIVAGHFLGGAIGSWIEDAFFGGTPALPAPNLQDHHIFPRQYEDYFNARGIDIDDYTVTVGQTQHLQGIHGNGLGNLPGGWNSQWGEFIANNPNASAPQVYQQAGKMMDQYGLNDLPMHRYGQ
jgi:RHS repeat-associated protein